MINIFLKELKTHLIDWRLWSHLLLAFLIPYVLFSYVWYLTNQGVQKQLAQSNPIYKVATIGLNSQSPLHQQLSLDSYLDVKQLDPMPKETIDSLILNDSLQLVLVFPSSFDSLVRQGKQAKLHLHYHQNQSGTAVDKVFTKIERFEQQLISQNAQNLGLSANIGNPIEIESHDLFDPLSLFSEAVNFILIIIEKSLATILTVVCWLFLLLLLGYSSLRAFALAKEYKTLMPLLTTNSIFSVVLGKGLGISLAGVLAVGLSLLGVLWSLDTGQEGWIATVAEHLQDLLHNGIVLRIILWAAATAWLVVGILSSFSLNSLSTYKASKWIFYAQTFVFLLVILGIVMLPTLNIATAFMPILNTAALFKGLIAGNLSTGLFILSILIPMILGSLIMWKLSRTAQTDN